MPVIIVDGKEFDAAADSNLLEALLSARIDIPYFCWHPAMGSVGACRQCAVLQYADANDTRGKLVMSCMTPVTDGARFSVAADHAVSFRGSVIENLMLNHPHDCPVCEEGGECHLQDMTVMVGHRDRRYQGQKTTFENQYLGPFIGHEMNRCITCYRCVRFYQDYAGGDDLSAFGSRDRVFFGRAAPGVLENEFAGNLVEVCPTGVFTDKTLSKHYTRKWDLQSSPTICRGCALGCNTYSSERYGELRRVHNRYNEEINGYFLCDRGRFGAQHVNAKERIPHAGVLNQQGLYDRVSKGEIRGKVSHLLRNAAGVVGIGSPRASLESNHALRQLVKPENYCNGMSRDEQAMHQVIVDVLKSHLNTPTLAEVARSDAIFILGEDTTNHAPMLALTIRQAVRNRASARAGQTGIARWHDAAVRALAQHERSPLVVATPMVDRLDDVAVSALRLAPEDITNLAIEVTALVSGDTHASATSEQAQAIADMLRAAQNPLIISGTSSGDLNIIQAAANLGIALQAVNPNAGILLAASECNSVGVTLMDNARCLDDLLDQQPELVIVLENDLQHRLGDQFAARMAAIPNLVVLDYLDNATVSSSNILLPAASFAESEGTFVNYEGRAQRSLVVYPPENDIEPSEQILTRLLHESQSPSMIRQALARNFPLLKNITQCAPDTDFRIEGSKVPRMTHRASGRTAMLADISVHEPMQPVDTESALAFTMEGNQQDAPASLRPYTWSPGWNSNQSIHKFQHETGQADAAEMPGILLLQGGNTLAPFELNAAHEPFSGPGRLIAQHHIFGSDPVSNAAGELATLIPRPYLRMNAETAASLGVDQGDGLGYLANHSGHSQGQSDQEADRNIEFSVIVDQEVATNCVIYPMIPQTASLAGATPADLKRIPGWQGPADPLRPDVILTDRTR